MSPKFTALLVYVVLSFTFHAWYHFLRPRIKYYKLQFTANMIFGILLTCVLPLLALNYFRIYNPWLNFCLVLMALAVVLHHTVLLFDETKNNKQIYEEIHIPVSHLLLGIPYILAGIFGATSLYPFTSSNYELIVFGFWFIETEIFGTLAVLIGLRIIK